MKRKTDAKKSPLDLRATPNRLLNLVDAGLLDRRGWQRAREIAGHTPAAEDWLHWLDRMLLVLGVVFTIIGVVFFGAYNWVRPHRYVEYAGLEIALAAVAAFVGYVGFNRLWGKMGLVVASLLVGVLLVLISQNYQTGADAYDLFLIWAGLITLWAAASRWGPMWLIWLALLNLAAILYWTGTAGGWDSRLYLTLIELNGVALAVWEYYNLRGIDWLEPRWIPRLMALVMGGTVVTYTLEFILADSYALENDLGLWLAPVVAVGILGLMFYVYQHMEPDLLMLALLGLGFMIVSVTAFARLLFNDIDSEDQAIGFACLVGLLIFTEVTAMAAWLTRKYREWGGD